MSQSVLDMIHQIGDEAMRQVVEELQANPEMFNAEDNAEGCGEDSPEPAQYSVESMGGLIERLRQLGPTSDNCILAKHLVQFLDANPFIKAEVPMDDIGMLIDWSKR